jgi:hypothetical protein
MLNLIRSIAMSYAPLFLLNVFLDLIAGVISRPTLGFNPLRSFANCLAGAASVWIWCHAYVAVTQQGDIGPMVFWGILPAAVANLHKFNWTYVGNAKVSLPGGSPPAVLRVKPTPFSSPTVVRTRNTVPGATLGGIVGAIAIYHLNGRSLIQPLTVVFSSIPIQWILVILGAFGLYKAVASIWAVVALLPKE